MALISSGIDMVRAIELPAGVRLDGSSFATGRMALVRWRSSWSDKFYQVYVNSRFAGTTIDAGQRERTVHLPSSFNTAVRIEVFAVDAGDSNTDFSGELSSISSRNGRVKIKLLRSQGLLMNSTAMVYSDGGSGEIDYAKPVNRFPLRIWPAWQDKAGFGMSRFGFSDFGFDSAAAVGFGRGFFGQAEFGFDADILEWVSEPLPTGIYKFAVKVFDENGRESVASETGEVTVTSAAKPAESLSIESFDKQTNQLLLSVV